LVKKKTTLNRNFTFHTFSSMLLSSHTLKTSLLALYDLKIKDSAVSCTYVCTGNWHHRRRQAGTWHSETQCFVTTCQIWSILIFFFQTH